MPGKPGKRKLARVYLQIPEPPAGTELVGYVRYSSEMQDADSIVTQKREILACAHRKGWIISFFYEEPERSGKDEEVSNRPVFQQMLEDAQAGKINGILCSQNNRWARNAGVSHTTLDLLRHLGVWWQTIDQNFTLFRTRRPLSRAENTIWLLYAGILAKPLIPSPFSTTGPRRPPSVLWMLSPPGTLSRGSAPPHPLTETPLPVI